jgi:NAD(P)-dependent dehydrogenase (short-subunit alcohol dehydrogenase family)
MQLKSIEEQVVVIAGASSGIGRECALRFGERGARVVIGARGEPGLAGLADEISQRGGQSAYAVCDVADFEQVKGLAATAVAKFGRIDTWVNVAAVSVYARFEDTTPEEFRRVMEVNYLGHVHGALAALPYLRKEGRGALIAVSSVESIVSMPLHGSYSASKHAVEGALDALRRELKAEGAQISVTSVKPATIDTPFFDNTESKMDVKPQGPPPIYEPAVVADCVLYAAEHPVRELFAGGAGKAMALGQKFMPTLMDTVLARTAIQSQRTDEVKPGGMPGNLYEPHTDETRRQGDFSNRARRVSVYTWMETHPWARGLALASVAGAAILVARKH